MIAIVMKLAFYVRQRSRMWK